MNLAVTLLRKSNEKGDNMNGNSCTLVIFGGTGDLTHRKLIPALYNLEHDSNLSENFAVVTIGRRDYTDQEYREELKQSTKSFSRFSLNESTWEKLQNRLYYKKLDFTNKDNYCELNNYLLTIDNLHQTGSNRIYYLAVAPEYFANIVDSLRSDCMKVPHAFERVVIEKPFGRDLESATFLNNKIVNAFTEANTYRIDHYLGKEMLQNIMVIRFANIFFEPLWNNKYIEQVQISSNETIGVETRGEYYEKSGAIRDMLQSHMFQLLSLITMEKPNDLSPTSIRDEKVKVLKELKNKNVVRGQYEGYRQEKRVADDSNTETFVALKVEVDNQRWKGVPFYIRTGKKMPKKSTEIVIKFNKSDNLLYDSTHLSDNLLVIKVQPMEGVFFQFNAKKPGTQHKIIPVQMDFCQNCQVGINSPEAYERLLFDVMRGDQTLFARWDEVEYSWKFVDHIIEKWIKEEPHFPNYKTGTWGPIEADELLTEDNHEWINLEGDL
ncbi:MAG: glucose-6-phosphate 1-dehydrogenase [Haloplasmataceae bacterium]|jgi:glucose-6-phosphate 1-dehydrogenase|nr:glucose-6-phosphate 1-dehydrogenase [Haloplasmataceae bacterium]